jgi:hypothetical protein
LDPYELWVWAPSRRGEWRSGHGPNGELCGVTGFAIIVRVQREPPISHGDVTTIMRLLGDIQVDVAEIRDLLEEDDGEEEASEPD